jgi:hypothetical protein
MSLEVTDPGRPSDAVALLRSTTAIRQRAQGLLARARAGQSRWFTVHDAAPAADMVAELTRQRYPSLDIPYHSRWRHFEAGGVDRPAQLAALIADRDPAERARVMIDLTVVSVLLDAGAGAQWHYDEHGTGQRFTRSEGLGVASWHAFLGGMFSAAADDPLRLDPAALCDLQPEELAAAFQVDPGNPLVGLDGRVAVLHRLGAALAEQPAVFAPLTARGEIAAHEILSAVLTALSGIWPADNRIGDRPVGDCWRHPAVTGPGLTDGWMPFHKLSQWLSYSLLEPFERAGVRVRDLDALTGLPEYRNGGLFLDTGVLRLRDDDAARQTWSTGDELVVEWRALTVALLDELAPLVRARLGADELPLARILEGGTWAAGRVLAQRLRGGLPPLTISSDGTVF